MVQAAMASPFCSMQPTDPAAQHASAPCAWPAPCCPAGPIKALVQERQQDWQARFGTALGLKVLQLTGDDNADPLEDLEAADIICSTPEKFGESAG